MRLRQLVLVCGLTSLLISPLVNALGLGEVKLISTLNQPLNAEITLLDVRDLTEEQIIVGLASPADFERNGVDRLYFYTEFKFKVSLDNPSGPIVKITSRNPVREPYLNFLVEARWTAGRLLREYTLLMDLPTFDDEKQVAPVIAPKQVSEVSQVSQSTQGRVQREQEGSVSTKTTRSYPPQAQDGEYVIKPNDTLWDIALAVRPDSSVSVHQAMVALYEANPSAFIGGNISRLREGRVLRIPDSAQMTSITKSAAATQFVQLESGMGAELSASRRTSTEAVANAEIAGRVSLAASNNSYSPNSGQGSGADNGAGKALESELAVTMEELDRVKSENTELNSRVKDLESQIQTMEKMVEISNEQMRALQVSAEKTKEEQASLTSLESVGGVMTSEASVVNSVGAESASSAAAVETAKPKAEVKKPETAKPKINPPKELSLVDQLVANAPWIGLGVAVLVGVIGMLVYSRRKQVPEEPGEFDSDFSMNDAELSFDNSTDDDEYEEPEPEPQQESFEPPDTEDDDVNPVDKADIFIAYGQLDKAEQLLLKGLDSNPNSVDIRAKLLEVYSQQKNVIEFDKHYAALIPIASPVILSRASELRSHIPNAGDFDMPDLAPDFSNEPAVEVQQQVALDDLDLDLGDDNDDFNVELDLTEDVDSEDAAIRSNQRISLDQSDDDFALDLDFGEPKTDLGESLDLDFESQADDIGEINLALDDIDDELPDDVDMVSIELEREPSLTPTKSQNQDLDLAEDDFNLDLDSDNVDLAALDDEMSSLDSDFSLEDSTEDLVEAEDDDIDFSLDDDSFGLDDADLSELDLGSDVDSAIEESESEKSTHQAVKPVSKPQSSGVDDMGENTLFDYALSGIEGQDVHLSELDSPAMQDDLDPDDMSFLAEADEAATKLDLARAYIDMGDMTGARDILSEVVNEGTSEQKAEAKDLLSRIDA